MQTFSVFETYKDVDPNFLVDKTAVVIDVLRASTTMTLAIRFGIDKIYPVETVEQAFEKKKQLNSKHVFLGGEREAIKVPGFDFGNSPYEFMDRDLQGGSLVFTSTNGTRALHAVKKATHVFIMGFVNLPAVVHPVEWMKKDVCLICAGTGGAFSLEDMVCAGFFLWEFSRYPYPMKFGPGAEKAYELFEKFQHDLPGMVKTSKHGQYLIDIGFEKDLNICSHLNFTNIVPAFKDAVVTQYEIK
jgi:2-phosphosulfolactate phosphatase